MRRLLCCLCLVLPLFAAAAPLVLSRSLLAVKVSDPPRQMRGFAPLLSRLDEVTATREGEMPVTTLLSSLFTGAAVLPGVDPHGVYWLLLPAEEAGAPQPLLLVIPLTDPAPLRAAVAAKAGDGSPAMQVFAQQAVLPLNGVATNYSGVTADLSPAAKPEVALFAPTSALDGLPGLCGFKHGWPAPAAARLATLRAHQQRWELVLTMQADDLTATLWTTPTPGSPLLAALADPPSPAPETLAAYLPSELAYAAASSAGLTGAPGVGELAGGLFSSLGLAGDPATLAPAFDLLAAECRRGRALGVTLPTGARGDAALVAVYRIYNPSDAAYAVRRFAQALGGMATVQPAAEYLNAVPVDLISVCAQLGESRPPFTLEVRVAYRNDVMCVTAGKSGKAEMRALLERVRTRTPGFTAGSRFGQLRDTLPEGTRAFEYLAVRDLLRAAVGFAPLSETERGEVQRWLSITPAQHSVITTATVARDGRLGTTITLPGEQLAFLTGLVKLARLQP